MKELCIGAFIGSIRVKVSKLARIRSIQLFVCNSNMFEA